MTDEEIRALRETIAGRTANVSLAYETRRLADEALRRGEEFDLLQTATIAEEKRLRARLARLEAALRSVVDHKCFAYPCRECGPVLAQARAALEEKP